MPIQRVILPLVALVAVLLALPAAASAARPTAIEVVLYGKFHTQIQLAICFEAGAGANDASFAQETLEYGYVLTAPDGTVVAEESSPAPGTRYLSTPTCRYGYISAHAANGLQPGTTYTATATATLTDDTTGAVRTLTDSLIVTTTGGCPLDAPEEAPPTYTYLHAIVDDANVVTAVHSIAPGTILLPPWSSYRYVPTYYGWPGRQYAGIGFIYDPIADDFGPPLPAGGEAPTEEVLELAGASGCDDLPGTEIDLAVAPGSADNCTVDGDAVVGLAAGSCAVNVDVRRAARSTRARTLRALLVVRGTGTRPIRPVRPQAPARPSRPDTGADAGGSDTSDGTRQPIRAAFAGGVSWSVRTADGRITARFPAARGTRYRAIARQRGADRVRTRCRISGATATCVMRLPAGGAWTITVVPTRGGTAGAPVRSRVVL